MAAGIVRPHTIGISRGGRQTGVGIGRHVGADGGDLRVRHRRAKLALDLETIFVVRVVRPTEIDLRIVHGRCRQRGGFGRRIGQRREIHFVRISGKTGRIERPHAIKILHPGSQTSMRIGSDIRADRVNLGVSAGHADFKFKVKTDFIIRAVCPRQVDLIAAHRRGGQIDRRLGCVQRRGGIHFIARGGITAGIVSVYLIKILRDAKQARVRINRNVSTNRIDHGIRSRGASLAHDAEARLVGRIIRPRQIDLAIRHQGHIQIARSRRWIHQCGVLRRIGITRIAGGIVGPDTIGKGRGGGQTRIREAGHVGANRGNLGKDRRRAELALDLEAGFTVGIVNPGEIDLRIADRRRL
ncbi:MAG: hypothetical protein ALAOOOJD_03810 [bacterium]|nr:hypothetical protein [bacterium]